MVTSIAWLVMLAVFAGLSMNLILQFGLALKGIAFDETISREKLLTGSGILFVTIILLWLIFSFFRSVLFLGFLEYVLLFPVSALVFLCLEYVTNRFIIRKPQAMPLFGNSLSGGSFAGGALAGAALFIMLNVAGSVFDAIALALGFSGSIALVWVIVAEIRRRSGLEAIPHWLRGGPLALIAMGLLSLVCVSGALMLFGVLGVQ
jgi:Na+-translocating ferredoxin:NAD+ oxidoreductase RnfA subunit